MTTLWRALRWALAGIAVAAAATAWWISSLAQDDGPTGRPAYGPYSFGPQAPRGGPEPRGDGYVVGSLGTGNLLTPLPPPRRTDIARPDNVQQAVALKTCFWPGPRLRSGYYTTDPDDYGIENQLPDIGNTFSTAWFSIPAGGRLVLQGEFPHLRHWSFVTYSIDGVPRDALNDIDIDPDEGSLNPFRPGVRRDAAARRYTITVVNGQPPAEPALRPRNTVYTLAGPGVPTGMHMRHYVPDAGRDWAGGVGLPSARLRTAEGRLLDESETCQATDVPGKRGRQSPITVSPKLWLALNSLPWRPSDRTPARDFEVTTMTRFYNREHLMLSTFFPLLPSEGLAVEKGGFWSNPVTRYGFTYLSQAHGRVYAVRGRMPRTPATFDHPAEPMPGDVDMRYWSLCTSTAPAIGNTVDCVHDENLRPLLDAQGFFTVVVSRAPDRPANARPACGVEWIEMGTGDGIPGGSSDFGVVINRHTLVDPAFAHSWFAVRQPGSEARVMGEYLPSVYNLRQKAHFEALGCPVDTARMAAAAAKR